MARGVRRSAAEWAALIDEWRDSGLSLPAFCGRRGLSTITMQGWVYKRTHREAIERARRAAAATGVPGGDPPAAAAHEAFLPVRVADAAPGHDGAGRSGVEVVLGAGRRVAVGPRFDAETLLRVLALLEDRPC